MKKNVVKLNESQLRKVVMESVKRILNEGTNSNLPDYQTLFEKTRMNSDFILQLKNQTASQNFNAFNNYIDGFYKWIAANKIMCFNKSEFLDDTYFIVACFDENNIERCKLITFELFGNEVDFRLYVQNDSKYLLDNCYVNPRQQFPKVYPIQRNPHLMNFINNVGEDAFLDMVDKGNGTYNMQTKQFVE